MAERNTGPASPAPPGGLGEGGQVTDEMVFAALAEMMRLADADDLEPERRGAESPEEFVARRTLAAALPLSPLSRRVDELEAENRKLEYQRDELATHVAITIETLVRGDELPVASGADPTKPPDPNPLQNVIDRLRALLKDV